LAGFAVITEVVVFPWETLVLTAAKNVPFPTLANDGWPEFKVISGKCDTLYDFLRHLRNAIAHGRMRYSSDSLIPSQVEIRFEDRNGKNDPVNWMAVLQADDLEKFCQRFSKFIDDTIG